jgi:hypothetical protein
MRLKRWQIAWLVAGLALVIWVITRGLPGAIMIPLGLGSLVGAAFAANRILSCPACSERLGSVFDKACARCGASLTDDPAVHPTATGPEALARAAEHMAHSRRILGRWAPIRHAIGQSIWVVAALAPIGMTLFFMSGPNAESLSGSAAVGVVTGLIVAGLWWLVVTHVVDNAFATGFLLLRGRCPLCRAWFNPPTTFGPGSLTMDMSLPRFCASCRSPLG